MSRTKPPAQSRRREIAPVKATARGKKPAAQLDTDSAISNPPTTKTHPIVGIGASAGGLEAFQQVLKALPSDTGMAFVLVQHLDPKHESMLTKLLAKSTPMPVTEVREGMSVEPNHIYVIPPNANMGIRNGVLHLTARPEPGSWHMPIDHFLQSLAEAHGNRAIGVILSGAASDGTIGLKAIKAEGGITFAQAEHSAKYDSMPHSAITAGCVDFVLPPAGIARELARLGRHPYVGFLPAEASSLPVEDNQDLRKIFRLLRSATGVDFTDYKFNTIRRRIARRMALQKLVNLGKYVAYLQENRAELDALHEDILIHVTGFFREPETFRQLKKSILPKVLQNKRPGEPIRVWVPGCSTGEEVYSFAMMLQEHLGDRASSVPVQIFGTDISQPSIERARAGIYAQSAVADLSADRLRRFFEKVEGGYSIRKPVREMCVFARQDLAQDPPFSRLDFLSCRNVLIYMGPVLQKKVMAILHYAVKPKGFLILGKSESMTGFSDLFVPVGHKYKIYSKKSLDNRLAFEMPAAGGPPDPENAAKQGAPAPPRFDVQKEADRLVVNHYAPPGLIANEHLQIIHFRGDASPFLAPSPGEASLSLLKMVRSELAVELSTAIHRAKKQGAPVRKEGIPLKRDGNGRSVGLQVIPIEGDAGERYVLVLFDETAADPAAETPALSKSKVSRAHETEIARLGRELQSTKEYLRSVIEDQEASQEELKAANEEVLSSNEELQSNNEELETAKEELQSTNEELVTVNEQLQNTNLELAQLNDDLANLLGGVNIPIVMLGSDLRIRRFTPLAERLLNLHPGDVGRPIGNIRPNLNIARLDARLRAVIDTVTVEEQEFQDHDGRWWVLRLRPYKTTDNRIDGVVMIFIDINALKVTQAALSEQSAFGSAILESAGALVMVTDPEGCIVRFNRACQQSSGYPFEEVKGKCIWNGLLIPGAEVEPAKAVYRKVLGGSLAVQHENHWITRSGERRLIAWNSTMLPYTQGSARHLVLIGRDITEQRLAESALDVAGLALRTSQAQLEKLAAGLLAAQEEERRRVSRELHDDVIQKLVSLTVEVETLIRKPPESKEVSQSKLSTLRDRISAISEDIRRTAQLLHPASLEHLGLAPVLKSYCADFGRREGIRVKFSERELPGKVSAEVALSLFRVVQEALRNVAKHSGARSAVVSLSGRDGALRLVIRDTGRGFDPQRIRVKGLGLISMDERVRLVGGTFLLQAKPGEGTRIDIRVPLSRKRNKPGAPSKRNLVERK